MLYLDNQHARKVGAGPGFIEIIRFLLLHTVVALHGKAFAVLRLQVRIRRFGAEAPKVAGVVAVEDAERVAGFGVLLKAFGEQHVRAQVHRATPKLGEPLTLNANMFDILGVLWFLHRRNFLIQRDLNRSGLRRVNRYLLRSAVQVAGRTVPLLPFALIHGELNGMAVGELKRFVPMKQGLYVVLTGRDVRDTPQRIAEYRVGKHCCLAG